MNEDISRYDSDGWGAPGGAPHTLIDPANDPAIAGVKLSQLREGASNIPHWHVPTEGIITANSWPGYRSMDLRKVEVGTLLLESDGAVWVVHQQSGYLQKTWRKKGHLLPRGWSWTTRAPHGGQAGEHSLVEARVLGESKLLYAHPEHLAALAALWLGAQGPQQVKAAAADHADFFQDLEAQLHRPATPRKALMKVTKSETLRGRAVRSNVDPLTPWALRAAAQRLMENISEDTTQQTAGVNLKRLTHLRARHEELQAQLDEVEGHLIAATALLTAEVREAATRA